MTAVAAAPAAESGGDHRSLETRLAHAVERGIELLRTDRVLQVALGMIAVQLALRGWALYGGWFVLDDFNFIARMGNDGLAPSVAGRTYLGHVMPAGMYLSWLNHTLAPWQWPVPATELLVLQAAADLTLVRLLIVMSGRRVGILPPLTLYLFSVLTLEGAVWWATAITLLPFQVALFLALTAHLRYLRTGRLRQAALAAGWIAAGLLFSEKSTLIFVVVAVVTVTWFAEGYGWRRLASAVRGRATGLAVYVVTGCAYVALYLLATRDYRLADAPAHSTYEVVRALVVDNYLPALVGGPLEWSHKGIFSFASPGDPVVLAALVTLGLVLTELLRHRVRSARALALPAVFVVVDVLLVLRTQLDTGDPFLFDYRFVAELAAISAIALAGSTMPVLGAVGSSAPRSSSELLDHPRRVAALVAVTAAVAVVSTIGWGRAWHSDHRARDWVQTLTGSLAESPAPVSLVDRVVPEYVMAPIDGSGGLASRLLAQEPNADFVDAATDDLSVIDDVGHLRPVLVPGALRAAPGPVAECGYRVASGTTTVPLDGPVTAGGSWVRIGYLSTGAGPVRVTAGDRSVDTTVRPGVHALFVRGGSSFDSVQLSGLTDPTFLCTDDVTVGVPEPLDTAADTAQGASQ